MSGAQTSSFANALFDPMMARRQTAADIANQYAPQHNQLLLDEGAQRMARQNEVDSREHVAQVAGYILSQPPETRPTAYKAALEWSRANGHPLPNAPAEYPGDQQLQMLQAMGIPAEHQYKMGMNRQANTAMLPPQGGAAAPAVSPYVPRNLPAGVTPDEDATVRTVIGEAGGESLDGRRAVAHVINNRATSSGMSPLDVTQAQGQFEPWGNPATRARLEGIDPNSAEYRQTLELVRNRGEDPTGGATHFFAPKLQASLGRDVPSWATGTPTVIGGHNFYKVGYGAPGGAQPGTTMVAGPGQYTPEQMRTLRAMQAADRPNTELRAEMDRYDAVNAHAADQAYRRQKDVLDAQHRQLEEKRQADADARAEAKAKTEADAAKLPYHGNSIESQDVNVLLTDDPSTQKYAGAYARQAAPKVNIDGSTVTPNMAAYAKPTYKGAGVDAPDYSKPVTTDPTHMSADQAKVATFATRLAAADVLIGQTSAAGLSLTQRGLAALPGGNYLASSEAQQYQQAQRDFINAVLRRESGAAIAESEFENARKQYFPQPGDGPAVIAQKAHNRATETSAFQREAGPAYVPPPAAASQAAHPPPPPGFKVIQ